MNANNGGKRDNLGLFNEVDEFVSIEIDESDSRKYDFIHLTSDEIKYLISIVETIEKNDYVYLCARGDSKKGKQANFINEQLNDFFIVGDKAKYHIKKPDGNKVGGKLSDQFISYIEDLPEKTQED